MKFEYRFRNTPRDYWIFYMTNTYHSLVGIINIIFTFAVLALIVSKWSSTGTLAHVFLIFALLLFPVLQPLATYGRSIRDSERIREETTVTFLEDGMHISVRNHHQHIRWNEMHSHVVRRGFVMIFPDEVHGYLLTNRILGDTRERLIKFLESHMG